MNDNKRGPSRDAARMTCSSILIAEVQGSGSDAQPQQLACIAKFLYSQHSAALGLVLHLTWPI